jgi:hypothetical protein
MENATVDVFISYSKQSPSPTHELAEALQKRGLKVWWDTDLLPGEKFEDALKNQLDNAKAVIVIWTAQSVASDWVKWEAAIAFQQRKLITTKFTLNFEELPEPFRGHHTVDVTDTNEVIAALRRLDLQPKLTLDEFVSDLAKKIPQLN